MVKNTKRGKLEGNFESEPYVVKSKLGSEIVAKSKDGRKQTRRNSSFFKLYQGQDKPNKAVLNESSPGKDKPPMNMSDSQLTEVEADNSVPKVSSSGRTIKPPAKLNL